MRSMLFYRSRARAQMRKLSVSLSNRYQRRKPARAATVAGDNLVTLGGMQYPATSVGADAGKAVAVVNAGRPAAATYAPAYGASVATVTGAPGAPTTSSARSGESGAISADQVIGLAEAVLAAMLDSDGEGSTLDADLLDGEHADAFALLAGRLGDVIALLTASAPAADVDAVKLHANDQQGRAGDHALHITPEATGRGYSFGTQAQLGGGLALPIASKAADYTATLADHTILIDASAGNVTVSLPAVATTHNGANGVGHIYRIKRIDASGNAATIDADGAETIDGAATHTLAAQYDAIAIQSDGSAWHIIGSA